MKLSIGLGGLAGERGVWLSWACSQVALAHPLSSPPLHTHTPGNAWPQALVSSSDSKASCGRVKIMGSYAFKKL